MQELFNGAQRHILRIIRSGKAESTNKKYDVYFSKFKQWCFSNNLKCLPASVAAVAVYISGLVQKYAYESVLLAHFYSIKWYHDFNLLENPCVHKIIILMMEGSKRILSRPVSKKEPITAEHLKLIVQKFGADLKNLMNIRICAMFLLRYAGFLRYSEIANLKMCNLNFFDTYVSLYIECKTDV